MPTINGRACVVNGTPIDKVFSDGRQVYGRNLYVDTGSFDNSSVWNNFNDWGKTGDKYDGLTVMESVQNYNGLGQIIQAKKGETYTFAVYARYASGTGTSYIYFRLTDANTNISSVKVSLDENWKRVSGTVTVTEDGPINARIERGGLNTNTMLIAGIKLEKNSTATPYSIAPEDVM